MKNVILILFLGAITMSFSSCEAQESGSSNTPATVTVSKAEPGTLKNVSVQEFKDLMAANPELQVVDVRTPGEWAEGTLPGVRKMNVNDPDFMQQAASLDKNTPVAVYCKMGGRSSKAGDMLVKAGFEEVYNMTGGITAWQGAGFEVQK